MPGSWVDLTLEVFGDLQGFEETLFWTRAGPILTRQGCSSNDDYIQRALFNEESLESYVLEIVCNGERSWLALQGFPPNSAVVFDFNPTGVEY